MVGTRSIAPVGPGPNAPDHGVEYPHDDLWDALREVGDPEMGISLVDMGMIVAARREGAEGEHAHIELTYTSNAIEGNTLTHRETAEVIEHGITVGGKSLREHLEAVNHYEAVQWMRGLAAQTTPIWRRPCANCIVAFSPAANRPSPESTAGTHAASPVRR